MIAIVRNPAKRDLRLFGIVGLPGALAVVAFFVVHAGAVRWVLLGVAGASVVVGSVAPRAMRVPFVGLQYLFFPVGFVVSTAVLLVVFYAVITPIGAVLRIFRRDPLGRAFPGKAASYWIAVDRVPQTEDYFRRF